MNLISSTNQYSQALIPFDPSHNPQTFVRHEMEKISKNSAEHLIQIAITTGRLFPSDQLPNPSVKITIGLIRKLDLHQDQRFEVAKRTMELNPKKPSLV